MTVEVLDFYRAVRLKGGLKDRLDDWLTDFCEIFAEALNRQLPVEAHMEFLNSDTSRPETALSHLPDGAVGYRIVVGNQNVETLVAMPRQLARLLISGLFGDAEPTLPENGDFTAAETTVFRYMIDLLAGAATGCRIDGEEVPCQVRKEIMNLHRMRPFKPGDDVVVARFQFGEPDQEHSHTWYWLIPYRILVELFEPEKHPGELQAAEQLASLKLLIDSMTAEFYTRLGTVKLKSSQLDSLREGDLVILDQKTTEPLRTFVGGEETFLAWPGRVGSRQAVQITRHTKE